MAGPRRNGTSGMKGGGTRKRNGRHPKMIVMVPTLGFKMLHGCHGIGLLQMMKVAVVGGHHGRTRGGPSSTPSSIIPGVSNKNGGTSHAKHHGPMIDRDLRNHPMDTM